jgi:hypothetical protein
MSSMSCNKINQDAPSDRCGFFLPNNFNAELQVGVTPGHLEPIQVVLVHPVLEIPSALEVVCIL